MLCSSSRSYLSLLPLLVGGDVSPTEPCSSFIFEECPHLILYRLAIILLSLVSIHGNITVQYITIVLLFFRQFIDISNY